MGFFKRFSAFLFFIGMATGAVLAVNNTQNIIDWWRLRSYIPSAEIEALASNSSFTDLGEKLFYVHDPELLNKSDFQESCTVGEATIVLGCYVSMQRIFLFDVDDERLQGVEEVTAAHEMLHAAYDRLSLNEKKKIDALVKEAYDRVDNDRIKENVGSYQSRDASVVSNELHSILGTEVRELPKDLEEYYQRYFVTRSTIVDLAETYSDEFEKRQEQIEVYDVELAKLNGEISRLNAENGQISVALEKERALIDSLRSNAPAYNEAVDRYNSKLPAFNQSINYVRTLIEDFNTIIESRNEIAVEERELVEAIDTRQGEL